MKKKGFKNRELKKGFTIFFAVLVSSLALSVGLAIYDLITRELTLSRPPRNRSTRSMRPTPAPSARCTGCEVRKCRARRCGRQRLRDLERLCRGRYGQALVRLLAMDRTSSNLARPRAPLRLLPQTGLRGLSPRPILLTQLPPLSLSTDRGSSASALRGCYCRQKRQSFGNLDYFPRGITRVSWAASVQLERALQVNY